MTGVWNHELEKLLRTNERELQWHRNTLQVRTADAERAMAALTQAQDKLLSLVAEQEARLQELLGRREDPEVLVRNYNKTTLAIYHADTRCGWAPDRGRRELILLSRAREMRLRPCSSCGYRVPKAGSQLQRAS